VNTVLHEWFLREFGPLFFLLLSSERQIRYGDPSRNLYAKNAPRCQFRHGGTFSGREIIFLAQTSL